MAVLCNKKLFTGPIMNDVEKALVDIANIRELLLAGTEFQGFRPAVIGLTGS